MKFSGFRDSDLAGFHGGRVSLVTIPIFEAFSKVTVPYLRPFLRPIFLSNNNVEVLMLDASLIAYNLNENTHGTIFKPRRGKEIEEQLIMCNLNDEHDNLRSIFCNPTPVIAVATYVESLYSLDCSDVQPGVGLYKGNIGRL
ncbi:hypothetical protein SO802_025495 [Lithocarpus litseifolius]|uniref:Uncharacterized protein n=1 Tax=Lithocarpus litseifolius TaxID=425828 RepID=A0AAW2C2F6_9ROSI